MNYRHDFHAGNFADVFKHVVLTRILLYLQRKPAPFHIIETHAGSGRYDLAGDAAGRTQEWRGGIGRIDLASMIPDARALVEPYLQIVGAAADGASSYPGSPSIALALTRPFDRMTFYEKHPDAFAGLMARIGRDRRAKALSLDGYVGLNASLPPVERRGLVLIDPPFEAQDEFDRVTAALLAGWRKWRGGTFMVWHPIKDRHGIERMIAALTAAGVTDLLRLELHIEEIRADGRLVANGLVVINPPYTLEAEMACILPDLARQLAVGRSTTHVSSMAVA